MGLEENKKLIRDHYRSFVDRDADAIRRQAAPDFVDHEIPPGAPPGPEPVIQLNAMLYAAFPDLRITIEDIVAENDIVAVRATWTGTHRGALPLLPVPVSNRPFKFSGMVFWRVRNGQLVERWATIDLFRLQQQLTAQ